MDMGCMPRGPVDGAPIIDEHNMLRGVRGWQQTFPQSGQETTRLERAMPELAQYHAEGSANQGTTDLQRGKRRPSQFLKPPAAWRSLSSSVRLSLTATRPIRPDDIDKGPNNSALSAKRTAPGTTARGAWRVARMGLFPRRHFGRGHLSMLPGQRNHGPMSMLLPRLSPLRRGERADDKADELREPAEPQETRRPAERTSWRE